MPPQAKPYFGRSPLIALFTTLLASSPAAAQTSTTPWQIAGEGSVLGLDRASGGVGIAGIGARVDFTLTRRIELEGRVTVFPSEGQQQLQRQGGKTLQSAIGVRGKLVTTPAFSVYAVLLPGLVHFTDTYTSTVDSLATGPSTHFAIDTGIGVEIYATPRWTVRGEITGPLYGAPGDGPSTIQPGVPYLTESAQFVNPWQVTGAVGYRIGPIRERAAEQPVAGRIEAGGQLTRISETDALQSATTIHQRFAAGGFVLARIAPGTYVDGAVNMFPENVRTHTPWDGGRLLQPLAGIAIGFRKDQYGAFVKTRAGVNSHSRAFAGETFEDPVTHRGFRPTYGRVNTPVLDTGGIFERYWGRHWIVRFDAGDTIAFYRTVTFTENGVATRPVPPPRSHSLQITTAGGWRF